MRGLQENWDLKAVIECLSVIVTTQSRIIGAVRRAHSQLWGTVIPVCSPYAPRKYDKRFGTPAIVWFTGWNYNLHAERLIYRKKECLYAERNAIFSIEMISRK